MQKQISRNDSNNEQIKHPRWTDINFSTSIYKYVDRTSWCRRETPGSSIIKYR